MGALSRWAGGLLDHFGARLPLVIGPAVAAVALFLFALSDASSPYWISFFVPIVTLGFGMAVTVAPLTTLVINSVPSRQAGVASGVNNAVASVANVFAVAIFGAIALGIFDHRLDRRLENVTVGSEVAQAVHNARGKFVTEVPAFIVQAEDRKITELIIKESLSDSIRFVMLLAAALTLIGAGCAAFMIQSDNKPVNLR